MRVILLFLVACLVKSQETEPEVIPFNDIQQWEFPEGVTIRFSVGAAQANASLILFGTDVLIPQQSCESSEDPDTYSSVLVETPTETETGWYFEVDLDTLEDVSEADTLVFGLVESDGECDPGRMAFVREFIVTEAPTREPLEPINTFIPWNKPQDLQRFNRWFQLTEGEQITFDVLSEHNLVEMSDLDAYNECDFSVLGRDGLIVDSTSMEKTVEFGSAGEVRYFSCNKTDPETGIIDCLIFDQRIRVVVVERQEPFALNWVLPRSPNDFEFMESVSVINSSQPIRFFGDAGMQIRQFNSKAAYDDCIFFSDVDEDNIINGNPSFRISDLTEDNDSVLYRDFLQGTNEMYSTLYFGSSTLVDCPGFDEQVTACECGLKKTFSVNLINPVAEEEEDDEVDLLYPLVAGLVGGLVFLTVTVFFQRRRNRDKQTQQALGDAMQKLDARVAASPPSMGINTMYATTYGTRTSVPSGIHSASESSFMPSSANEMNESALLYPTSVAGDYRNGVLTPGRVKRSL